MLCLCNNNKVNIDKIFERGDFSFIKNKKEQEYLNHYYKAIDNLFLKEGYEGWKLLRYNDFNHSFRNNHINNERRSIDDNGLKLICENIKIWDTIIIENEEYIKKINFPRFSSLLKLNIWDTPHGNDWYLLSRYLFESHTEETYNKSIRNLSFIANYGWKIFVIKYPIF